MTLPSTTYEQLFCTAAASQGPVRAVLSNDLVEAKSAMQFDESTKKLFETSPRDIADTLRTFPARNPLTAICIG